MIPVMIIEDEFLVRIGIKSCISWEEEGYEVIAEEEDGGKALALYQKFHPKLIITDIRLPHKNGLEIMKEIREYDQKVKFIIISAYDDFEIAREAIGIGVEGYFLKGSLEPEEIVKLLRQIREKLSEDSMEDTILKEPDSLKQMYRNAFNRETEEKEYYVCLLKVRDTDLKSLAQMVHSFFCQKDIENRFGTEDNFVWILAETSWEKLENVLMEMDGMLRRYVHSKVFIGVSEQFAEGKGIREKIYEAVLALYSCNMQEQKQYKVYHGEGNDYYSYIKKVEEAFQFNQSALAKKYLEEVRLLFKQHYSVKSYERFIYKMVGVLADYGLKKPEMEYYHELMEMLDAEEAFSSLISCIDAIECERRDSAEENIYIVKAMEYVYENYGGHINIGKIAEDIHVSPNYLGKLFVNETGEYLTDFINRIRIEKAKELLISTRKNINEIAEKVGISDQRYFAKLFKKYSGISPKEYRKQVNKE